MESVLSEDKQQARSGADNASGGAVSKSKRRKEPLQCGLVKVSPELAKGLRRRKNDDGELTEISTKHFLTRRRTSKA